MHKIAWLSRFARCFFASCALGCGIGGCSFGPTPPDPADIPLQGFEVYFSRPNFTTVEFEQFRFLGASLYAECGTIDSPSVSNTGKTKVLRSTPATPSHEYTHHKTLEQKIGTLSPDAIEAVKQLSWLISHYSDEINSDVNSHESSAKTAGDSGTVHLKFEFASDSSPTIINVPFDSIADTTLEPELFIRRLVHIIRESVGDTLCGRQNFYGIETSK